MIRSILPLLLSAACALSGSVNLAWNPNPEVDLNSYKLYRGTQSHVYTVQTNVGNVLSYTVQNLADGQYYFALTALNHQGMESGFSAEVTQTLQSTVTIGGRIVYCLGGPFNNIILLLTGTQTFQTATSGNGDYLFTVPMGGSYMVIPSKSPLAPGSSQINTVDVLAVQRHYIGLISLTGCAFTAGDVNGSGRIDTVDAVAIQRFVVGLSTSIANTGKYQFAPINRVYNLIVVNQVVQDYSGLIFGDVVP